jgi:pimeloyl-ACP methyl ester carboxylesterase
MGGAMVVNVNGIEMYWEEFGEGEPLLWLHGGMGSGADWQYIFKELPAGYRLIAPDLRGHGASTNPSGAFSFRQCAVDVMGLLDHLNISTFKAIGLSGGGMTLLHMATTEARRVQAMVIVSAPPYFPAEARAAMKQFSEAVIGPEEMDRMRKRHKYGDAQIQQLFAIVRALADSYDDVNFTPPYLSTIEAETLIVVGDRDPLYPISIALELYRAIPRSFLWVVPNGGHGPIFRDTAAQFVSTAMAFLAGRWSHARS